MNIKIEDIINEQISNINVENFESYSKFKKAHEFEEIFRKTLSNKQKQDLTQLLELETNYQIDREYEIICYVLDILRSILKG